MGDACCQKVNGIILISGTTRTLTGAFAKIVVSGFVKASKRENLNR